MALFFSIKRWNIIFDLLEQANMKWLWFIKKFKGYYWYDEEEKCVKKDEVEEIFAYDEDRVYNNGHFLVGVPKDGKYFDYCCSSEVIIDNEIAIRNESSNNDEDNRKTDDITSWPL